MKLRSLLLPAAALYAAGAELRSWLYQNGHLKHRRLDRPVVSVGNLTLGGTGKTPFVASLARRFRAQGLRPSVLTRGYGRSSKGVVLVSDGSGPRVTKSSSVEKASSLQFARASGPT